MTQVPTAEVAPSGEENRGPGQTGELWVGLARKAPQTADDAAAIVAFWDSAAHAASAPNGPVSDLNRHAFAFGAVTVQPANPLLASIAKTHPVHTQAQAQAAVKSGLGKIESCLH